MLSWGVSLERQSANRADASDRISWRLHQNRELDLCLFTTPLPNGIKQSAAALSVSAWDLHLDSASQNPLIHFVLAGKKNHTVKEKSIDL